MCLSLSSKKLVISFTKIRSANMERKRSREKCLLSRLINKLIFFVVVEPKAFCCFS